MFGRDKRIRRLQDIEHLKAYVGTVIDAWHAGAGLEGAPITLDLAKLLIWREIQSVWTSGEGGAAECMWVRVAGQHPSLVQNFIDKMRRHVVSARCLGPRAEGNEAVAYVWLDINDLKRVFATAEECECKIRDWEYYA